MPVPSTAPTRRDAARARPASTLAFLTNGALLGALIPHYPEAKAAFGLGSGAFGLLVIALTVGAACAGTLAAPVLRRWGSATTMLWGSLGMAVLVTGAGLTIDAASSPAVPGAGGWVWAFVVVVFAAGVGDAIVDTAQNAQGLRVQSVLGRPILTSMHAGWSLGAGAGAGLGALAVGAGMSAGAHLALNGAACAAILFLILGRFLPDRDGVSGAGVEQGDVEPAAADVPAAPGVQAAADVAPRETTARARHPRLLLIPIVLIAMAGFSVEEFGNAWTSLFLQAERGLDPATAGLGASTLLLAQFVGRLLGDRFVAALGRPAALGTGMALVVVGLTLTLLMPVPAVIFAGLGLAGLGCAVVVPTAFALADELPGLPPQTGLAVVSWLMRLAGLGLSPLVGLLAAGLPLTLALFAFVALAGLGLVLSLALPRLLPHAAR